MALAKASLKPSTETDRDRWNLWEMVNVSPRDTGLRTYIHCYSGPLRHAPRIKVQIDPGPPNYRNSVSVAIHDPEIVDGRPNRRSRFKDSAYHSDVKQFINKNRDLLLRHARKEIDDRELLDGVQRVYD